MSLTLKISSLAIRTLAKPIASYIKRNAREHERFRKFAVGFAQRLHRVDMRLRLGLLQDAAAIDKQIARETAEAEARRKKAAIPTVKTEAQAKREEDRTDKERKAIADAAKALPRIRPLSEAKAIETGANFISEAFLFCVAGGIIIMEYWRSRRRDAGRREDIDDRLEQLEKERDEFKAQLQQVEEELQTRKTAIVEPADSATKPASRIPGMGHSREGEKEELEKTNRATPKE